MNRKAKSRILAVLFGFNVFQFIMILVKPGENISWVFVIIMTIPLFFVSYYAMKLNKVAYLLLLYWFVLQLFSFDLSDVWKLTVSYGFIFRITFFNEAVALNPIALLLLVLALLEVDKVFTDDPEPHAISQAQGETVTDPPMLLESK